MKSVILILILFSITILNPQKAGLILCQNSKSNSSLYSVNDRADGVHNAGNMGLFFENRGKLYPRRITQGPSGEFPIYSGKNYIYRMNPMVGIPGNVIQARYTMYEEWEAVGGYHNPALGKIAFSDNPSSWHPINGWPVKDSVGNPIFISDQDSYCVYSDSNNSISLLNIFIHQTGYVFSNDSARDIIFFKYEIENKSLTNYDSLYFSLYCDIDVGDVSGGVPEYADDRIGFDKENHFLYFFDDGFSPEWSDTITGYFGVVFLETPNTTQFKSGVTDFHYNLYDDDVNIDTVQFGIFSSSEGLYNSVDGYKYFHPGNAGNIHFDDTSTVPASGLDIVANVSSGPYNFNINQGLIFYTAIIGGYNYADINQNMITAKNVFNSFVTSIEDRNEPGFPVRFELYQNYPNPFNPSTTISWQSPISGKQTIKLFDVLGREIETIVDGYYEAGNHSTLYIPNSTLSSGVYFYQLRAGSFVETKKMILLR